VDQAVSGVQSNPFNINVHLTALTEEVACQCLLLVLKEKHSVVLGETLNKVFRVSQAPSIANVAGDIGKRPDHLDEADLVGEGLSRASIHLLGLSQEARIDSSRLEVTLELRLDFDQMLFHELDELCGFLTSHHPHSIAHAAQRQHALDAPTQPLGVAVEGVFFTHAKARLRTAAHSGAKRLKMMV